MKFLPDALADRLASKQRTWLVTGGAGFIGSNLVECLLANGQFVIVLDNFATGHRRNLEAALEAVGGDETRFRMVYGDVRDRETCRTFVRDADVILHQAALGSVPRSIDDPLASHDANVTGFINMLDAAREAKVPRFIYASSSSVYGNDTELPKKEDRIGEPLSPYAATKLVNEIYAGVYAKAFGYKATGLRYFNVFGPRQDPEGPYATVIPKWTRAMVRGEPVTIHGDGETSRDFCFVADVVQANIRAALSGDEAQGEVYNVAAGSRTSLNELFGMVRSQLRDCGVRYDAEPLKEAFRKGDMRHTLADTAKAASLIGYVPGYTVRTGIEALLPC